MEHAFHDIVNLGFILTPIFSHQNVLFVETSKLTFFLFNVCRHVYMCFLDAEFSLKRCYLSIPEIAFINIFD